MRKAFTLIELIVALGLLAMVLVFASAIFQASIGAQQMAVANGEIMQKLRIITQQLDADFQGILSSYGGQPTIRTETYTDANTGLQKERRSDSLAFFANGAYQSTRQYGQNNDQTIVGSVASILYATPDPNSYTSRPAPRERLLLRCQTILYPAASDDPLQKWSDWQGEYCCTSLEQWRLDPPYRKKTGDYWAKQPLIDPRDPKEYQSKCLARGVDNFTISYFDSKAEPTEDHIPWTRESDTEMKTAPRAFKFEFTLYDSKGIIRGGRTFSHIVLLDR
jgi:prepilin-type N-terminal cleavage/methylation domain-containing protein